MAEKNRKIFIGKKVFVIDYLRRRNLESAFVTSATIVDISYEKSIIKTKLVDGSHQNYRYCDFGKMVFCTRNAAYNFLKQIPKVGDYVFIVVNENKIISKDVTELNMHIRPDTTLLLCFTLHKDNVDTPIYSINKDIFLTRFQALYEIKKRKHAK